MNPLINLFYGAGVRTANLAGLLHMYPHSDLEHIVARANSWMAHRTRSPVFMWVHLFPPHAPYAAPSPWLGEFDRSAAARTESSSYPSYLFDAGFDPPSRIHTLEARYDESIAYLDDYFGKLVSSIRQNLGPNTAIILTADHGESFEHGYGGHGGVMLYEDLVHIPLIIVLPGSNAPAERREDLASQIDIAPTIAAIAGISPPTRWTGRSLLASSENRKAQTAFTMNFEQNDSHGVLSTGSVAVLQSDWKLVRFLGDPLYPNMPKLKTQLFDLAKDPREMTNVADAHPEIVAPLSAEVDAMLVLHGGPTGE
jgi:arylsulfatase A-like enzyme